MTNKNHDSELHQDPKTGEFFLGRKPLIEITGLRRELLAYFLENPGVYLTKTELIVNVWQLEQRYGVTDQALYQHICRLRKVIRNHADHSTIYIVTWHGYPEGGYRLLPQGLSKYAKNGEAG